MRKRILAFCTACIIAVSFCLYCVAPVRVSASGGGVGVLYDLYQLYLLLMGIATNSSNSNYGLVEYYDDTFCDDFYYLEDYDTYGTKADAAYWPIFDAIHLDDLVTNINKLVASWDETYETVGSVGSFSVSTLPSPWSVITSGISTDGQVLQLDSSCPKSSYPSDTVYPYVNLCKYYTISSNYLYYVVNINGVYKLLQRDLSTNNITDCYRPYHYFCVSGSNYSAIQSDYSIFDTKSPPSDISRYGSVADIVHLFDSFYVTTQFDSFGAARDHILSSSYHDPDPTLSTFVGPVYSYPAAEQLAKDNNTASGIRLAVDTDTGVADLNAVLDRTGCEDMDDVVAGVAAGTIPMSDVFDAAGVTPYILTDVDTGEIITDMDVSATAECVKPVALTSDLAVPADLAAAEALTIPGRTYDPDTSKFKLPLFNFFPFCLPWDIYKVLSSFDADPVAPVIEIPVGKSFRNVPGVSAEVTGYVVKVDFSEEQYAKWFSLLRLLECVGIIVGLVLLARALIHGGN